MAAVLMTENESLEIIMREDTGTLEAEPLRDDSDDLIAGHWMRDTPSWCSEKELAREHGIGFWDGKITILDFGYGKPPESFLFEGRTWTKRADFGHFGEAECPGKYEGDGKVASEHCVDGRCYACEEEEGEDHGYLYHGEFRQVIYSSPEED